MQQPGFHTPSGYRDHARKTLTEAMEDYLEMICRRENEGLHVGELAAALQVRPSSATRMVQKLAEGGWLTYTPYDVVRLTGEGRRVGHYLLWRHETLMKFFRELTGSLSLEEVEQIEHFLRVNTVRALHRLTEQMVQTGWGQKTPPEQDPGGGEFY